MAGTCGGVTCPPLVLSVEGQVREGGRENRGARRWLWRNWKVWPRY